MPTIAMRMPRALIKKDPFTVHAIKVSQATVLPVQVTQDTTTNSAKVAQLVEHRAAMREVVSSTPSGPTIRVLK